MPSRSNRHQYSRNLPSVVFDDPLADLDLTPIYSADDVLDLEATNGRSARSEKVTIDPDCIAGASAGLL
jgi:hypothetical protein